MDGNLNILIAFIRRQSGEYNAAINGHTKLEDDLGITGDDAEELITAFGKEFNVDISNFIFDRYFYPEPIGYRKLAPIKELKVEHLLKAIVGGRLDEEVIS